MKIPAVGFLLLSPVCHRHICVWYRRTVAKKVKKFDAISIRKKTFWSRRKSRDLLLNS